MKRLMVLIVLIVGCSKPEPLPDTQADPAADMGVPDVPAAEPDLPPAPPTLPAEELKLDGRDAKVNTADGIEIEFTRLSHKHGKGFSIGIWGFTFRKDAEEQTIEIREQQLAAETVQFGRAFVFSGEYSDVTVSVLEGPAPDPLNDESVMALAEAEAKTQGLDWEGTASSSNNGIFEIEFRDAASNPLGEVRVGLYTGTATFSKPKIKKKKK